MFRFVFLLLIAITCTSAINLDVSLDEIDGVWVSANFAGLTTIYVTPTYPRPGGKPYTHICWDEGSEACKAEVPDTFEVFYIDAPNRKFYWNATENPGIKFS